MRAGGGGSSKASWSPVASVSGHWGRSISDHCDPLRGRSESAHPRVFGGACPVSVNRGTQYRAAGVVLVLVDLTASETLVEDVHRVLVR